MDKSWKRYIQNHNLTAAPWVEYTPDICVVIPCYNEARILQTLESLEECEDSGKKVLVIVVVNSGEQTPEEIVAFNRNTYNTLLSFSNESTHKSISYYPVIIEGVKKKFAGVGFARKTGLDTAVSLFASNNTPNGVIVSLDADTTVQHNYLVSITNRFFGKESITLSTHPFRHRQIDVNADESLQKAIDQYELYLRYFRVAQAYCGFPYAIHTVGSAFAISADLYVKSGGMNRRQGGEDFYFLHKVIPNAKHAHLTETCVYPDGRVSNRVPFGTGAAIKKLTENEVVDYLVYKLESFEPLKELFDTISLFFKTDKEQMKAVIAKLHPSMKEFLESIQFAEKLEEMNRNASTIEAFQKKFFLFFDAFKMVKYLNFAHERYFARVPIKVEAQRLLELLGYESPNSLNEILLLYYQLEIDS